VDSSWNCHFDDESSQTRQLMRRDLVSECSTRIMRSPTWNRSSTLGMYNLGKWLAEGVDLGIQMSPSLGILRCLSASFGAILRKVGGVVVLRLKLRDGHPPLSSITHFHPDLSSGVKTTVSYFDRYISYSGLIGTYSYNSYYTKTQRLQYHYTSRWHDTPSSVEVKPTDDSLFTSLPN
jgi:hypothetical protein